MPLCVATGYHQFSIGENINRKKRGQASMCTIHTISLLLIIVYLPLSSLIVGENE